MLAAARQRYDACLEQVTTWDAFMAALNNRHMALAPWADEEAVRCRCWLSVVVCVCVRLCVMVCVLACLPVCLAGSVPDAHRISHPF